jgi:hypothetical protein
VTRREISEGAPEQEKSLFVKDLIRGVHRELLQSRTERRQAGEPPMFQVKNMTIEVNFVVVQSKSVKGGFSFKLITVGGLDASGSHAYQQQQVHKMTLILDAIDYSEEAEDGLVDLELPDSASSFRPREREETRHVGDKRN